MQQPAPPWRVLDEPVGAGASGPPGVGASGDAPATTGMPGEAGRPPWLVAAALAAATSFVLAAFLLAAHGEQGLVDVSAAARTAAAPASGAPAPNELIVVEVAGAVIRPGVYSLPKGARAGDAIAAAGGYGPRVDAELASRQLNLAALLRDGERVRVPSRDDASVGPGEVPSAPAGSGAIGGSTGGGGLIDLNRASVAELELLPGIGPATAAKIIAARTERPFASVDELGERKLVAARVLDEIRGLVTVR